MESVSEPRANEAIVFKNFFVAGLHMPPHPVLTDILCKFHVQLHHLMLNAIVTINKFICAVTSYGGRLIADVFAQRYEIHYQNKKIILRDAKLPSLRSLDASPFTLAVMENRQNLPSL
jgi:H+/gluconate symporter-like permease